MNACVHLWYCLCTFVVLSVYICGTVFLEIFLELEMVQTKVVEKIKTYFISKISPFFR